ncbi:potassium-transporting ATPase subunit KdpC [Streptomyces sp. Je 1-4]|uniref:potassium-transporting ATPase subunit KdpC n=1 Tax=Streptomyces TaxID=1883 RepID=UPI0021D82962|nr:potassium-transporting ATPase subunit KdpC [Streptomyces sp. Je 1-4]UYB39500.1 potassium-transporting ATPase subunit KdpC [Streptomyces sp. Je 1-4]UZQ35536.1 potassium-transporting ATPase subunit KdpC [Streptomyces sp. Je 1-4] [Streptomyces sp. Je 1-4 4N24]UZQ42954.1 potassium-transporting ATPase subunit KdpC [Streptomyces sp. Je 1-4] [Streptomyces sp. Je 1-4 4N24_ara]
MTAVNNSVRNTARLIGAGLRALLVLTVVCGVLYPLVVTGVAQAAFPHKANGSEVSHQGKVIGSSLIGQRYDKGKDKDGNPVPDLRYFQPRPSAGLGSNKANGVNTQYDLQVSGASNLGATNTDLIKAVKERRQWVSATYGVPESKVPADAVTSSGSGLDPDISPVYAQLQTATVARRNHLPAGTVDKLVKEHTDGRTLGFLGEPRVNVLELNIALKELVRSEGKG